MSRQPFTRADYEADGRGCTCFICPPCGYCMAPPACSECGDPVLHDEAYDDPECEGCKHEELLMNETYPVNIHVPWAWLPACPKCSAGVGEMCWNRQATRNPVHVSYPHRGRLDLVQLIDAQGAAISRPVRWLMLAKHYAETERHELADQVASLVLRGAGRAEADLMALTGLGEPFDGLPRMPL